MVKPFKNTKVQKLDLSLDIQSQGVTVGQCDVVIGRIDLSGAQNVACLAGLLNPGGRLLWESTNGPDLAALEGAWFSGIGFSIPGAETTIFAASTSTNASDTAEEAVLHEVQLVSRNNADPMFRGVQDAFALIGWHAITSKLVDCKTKVGDRVIMLTDLEGPLLSALQKEELAAIQFISNTASSIL